MDPLNDIHFEQSNIPLNGRQLYHDYWYGNIKGIYKINSGGIKTKATKKRFITLQGIFYIYRELIS